MNEQQHQKGTTALDNLIGLLNKSVQLTDEDKRLLALYWNEEKTLKKWDYLIEKGKVERRLYFIQEGTLRIFYPHKLEEICVGFGYANTLICSFPSFMRSAPSDYHIQALSSCSMLSISKDDFYRVMEQSPAIQACWNLSLEEALLGKIERETEVLAFTPQERANRLFERSPHVFQLIPKKYIASYLGMTPETLSRIRIGAEEDKS